MNDNILKDKLNIKQPRILLINTFISNDFKQKNKFCNNIVKTSKYNL
jgi:hypothetical protein